MKDGVRVDEAKMAVDKQSARLKFSQHLQRRVDGLWMMDED